MNKGLMFSEGNTIFSSLFLSALSSKIYGTTVTLKVYLQSQICRILRDQTRTRLERR